MSISVKKDKYHGWIVSDSIRLNDELLLEVSTKKMNGKVQTSAMVSHIKDGFKTHALFQDFYKVYLKYDAKRVTEKTVVNQHGWLDTNTVITDAKAFYSI